MKVILGKEEIADAVECYLAKQGLNTDIFDLDVRIAVSRSSEDNKIEVEMTKIAAKVIPGEPIARSTEEVVLPFGGDEASE